MSNTLEMSKNVPVTSSGGLELKDLYISCTVDKSRHSHESEGLKPNFFFFFFKNKGFRRIDCSH